MLQKRKIAVTGSATVVSQEKLEKGKKGNLILKLPVAPTYNFEALTL